jgi:PPM family protein phosphatase
MGSVMSASQLRSARAATTPPMQRDLMLEAAGVTHVGLVRAHNEDSLRLEGETGVFVLSDGMGGYNAGEVASAIAVETVVNELAQFKRSLDILYDPDPVTALAEAVELANRKIIETGALRPECLGMGATIVATMLMEDKLWFAHVGDSRLYRLRGTGLEQLTRDHSVGQEMRDAGVLTKEQARHYQGRGVLTRALGVEPDVRPDVFCTDLQAEDVFIMCSDGLSDMVDDELIGSLLLQRRKTSCNTIATALQQAALEGGGNDNVTALVIRCVEQG